MRPLLLRLPKTRFNLNSAMPEVVGLRGRTVTGIEPGPWMGR